MNVYLTITTHLFFDDKKPIHPFL